MVTDTFVHRRRQRQWTSYWIRSTTLVSDRKISRSLDFHFVRLIPIASVITL